MPAPRTTAGPTPGRPRSRARTAAGTAAVAVLVGGALAWASPAQAATFAVGSPLDSVDVAPGDGSCADAAGLCTLRAAVMEANALGGAHSIELPAAPVLLTLDGPDEDGGATGDVDVTAAITFVGGGSVIADALDDRAFHVLAGGSLTATDLDVSGGTAGGAPSATGGASGGAFLVAGTLDLTGGELSGNEAARAGGAIEGTPGSSTLLDGVTLSGNATGPAPGNGGALHVTGNGSATLTGLTVTGNTAAAEGGGLWNGTGTMTVIDSTVDGNTAGGALADDGGGGLFNNGGTLVVDGGSVTDNVASGAAGSGGGLFANGGTLEVTGTEISGNDAVRAGGGVEALGVAGAPVSVRLDQVDLSGNSTGAAPGNGGGLHLTGPGTVEVTGSDVTGNTAALEGGGLWNSAGGTMTVTDTLVEANTASGAAADNGGGGLFNDGGRLVVTGSEVTGNAADGAAGSGGGVLSLGTLEVRGTLVADNAAERAGGGIEAAPLPGVAGATSTTTVTGSVLAGNDAGTAPGNGGGLHLTGAGTVDVATSTVTGNTAVQGGGLWSSAAGTTTVTASTVDDNAAANQGGGLYDDGGTLTATNVTIDGNTAATGGGAFGDADGTLSLVHATVTRNSTGVDGTVSLRNSVVAENVGTDCVAGGVTSAGGNVLGDGCAGGAAGDRTGVTDAGLGDLADNGGSTLTRLPAAGSPVVDVAATTPAVATDQRGAARPADGDRDGRAVADAGAVELAGAVAPPGGGGGGLPVAPPARPVPGQPDFTG